MTFMSLPKQTARSERRGFRSLTESLSFTVGKMVGQLVYPVVSLTQRNLHGLDVETEDSAVMIGWSEALLQTIGLNITGITVEQPGFIRGTK